MQGLFDRAPHHVQGSFAVLQTLCEKWMGSTDAMFGVARELAAEAPDGSAVCLLPVMAHIEHHEHLESDRGGPAAAARHMTAGATRTELRALRGPVAGRAGRDSAARRPDVRATTLGGVRLLAGRRPGRRPAAPGGDRAGAEGVPRGCTRASPGEVLGVARRWAGLARRGTGGPSASAAAAATRSGFSPG